MEGHDDTPKLALTSVQIGGKEIDLPPNSFELELLGEKIPISAFSTTEDDTGIIDLRPVTILGDLAHTIHPGEAYEVILKNKDIWLSQYDPVTGTFPSVVREQGKIIEHAKLKPLGPDMLKAAKAIGMQVLLVSIAIQIKEIDKKIDYLIRGQHDDRLAKIEAGIKQLKEALLYKDKDARNYKLMHAAQTLSEGISQSIRGLRAEINACPPSETGLFDALGSDGLEEAGEKMGLAQESAQWLAQGIPALYMCHAFYSPAQYEAAIKTTQDYLNELMREDHPIFYEAREKMRLVAGGKQSRFNLHFWRDLYKQFEVVREKLQGGNNSISDGEIQLRLEVTNHADL